MLVFTMKTIIVLILLFPLTVNAAALVFASPTRIDTSGIIGEVGTMEAISYRLIAEFTDQKSHHPHNTQELGKLDIFLGESKLKIEKQHYKSLKNVTLKAITISYIKVFSGDSLAEVSIPFGKNETCINHDDKSSHYRQPVKIITYKASGEYLRERVKKPCTH